MRNLKNLKKFVILILVFALLLGQNGIKVNAKLTYRVYYKGHRYTYTGKSYKVYYNNQLISSSSRPGMLVNGNIMIPYKYSLVERGPRITTNYNKSLRRLTLFNGNQKIELLLNSKTFYLNGVRKKLRTVPFHANYNGTYFIMIPAKAVLKLLGFGYYYDKEKSAIYITGNTGAAQSSNVTPAAPPVNKAATNTVNSSTNTNPKLVFTASHFKGLSTSQFISLMGPIARENYKKTGVLASVTLAQAILESGWGRSYLCQKGNNLFGMKAVISGNNWKGTTWDGKTKIRIRTGEEYGGRKVKITANFRAYKNIYQSVQDHSAYLLYAKNGTKYRYAGLAATKDYAKQVRIIKKGGYATSSSYINSLLRLIRTYKLTKYDVK